MVYFFTDDNHNAIDVQAGNLLVDTTGVVDASGGKGAGKGGDARSDGRAGYVPAFPEFMEQIAIFLNCDGAHGETLNWMENRGHLIARGGAANGNGGDIVYHGVGPGQRGTPLEPESDPSTTPLREPSIYRAQAVANPATTEASRLAV